jgi:hypothetical protein
MYSADGVLNFAGLIGAGLVEIAETDMTFMAPVERKMFRQTSHKRALTQRGKLLVEAWLPGKEKDYRDLISSSNPGIAGENA